MEQGKRLIKNEAMAMCKITAGCFLYALSVVLFIDPAKIIPGSVTGIGVVVKTLTGFPIGLLSILINVPLVIWGTIVLGKRLLIYTGLTVLLSSAMIDLLAFLRPFTQDVFLASVFGGVVMGVGLGLILDAGGTTGGTTVVGRLVLKKYPHIPMGDILLVGDFIIIMVGSLLLKDWDLLLYSVVDLYVCVVVINKVMYGFKISSLSVIMTKKGQKIGEKLQMLGGCSVLHNSEDKVVVTSRKKDVSKIQSIVEGEDDDAALAAFDATYSFGRVYNE